MSMKDNFNQRGAETYEQRERWLQERADHIEQMLETPQTPAPALRPTGQLRAMGDEYAREQLQSRKIDINEELEQIKQERVQSQELKRDQEKSL